MTGTIQGPIYLHLAQEWLSWCDSGLWGWLAGRGTPGSLGCLPSSAWQELAPAYTNLSERNSELLPSRYFVACHHRGKFLMLRFPSLLFTGLGRCVQSPHIQAATYSVLTQPNHSHSNVVVFQHCSIFHWHSWETWQSLWCQFSPLHCAIHPPEYHACCAASWCVVIVIVIIVFLKENAITAQPSGACSPNQTEWIGMRLVILRSLCDGISTNSFGGNALNCP